MIFTTRKTWQQESPFMAIYNCTLQCYRSILVLVFLMLSLNVGYGDPSDFIEYGTAFLEQYCINCHTGDQPAAELALDSFPTASALIDNRDVWERVIEMLTTNQMPPANSEQPPLILSESIVEYIESILVNTDSKHPLDPGQVTARRLNKVEYKNTVRDLLGIDFDPTESFPDDSIGYGFNNIGDVLRLSPLLMERYMRAAEEITEQVILVNPPRPAQRYRSAHQLEPRHTGSVEPLFRLLDPMADVASKTGPFTTSSVNFGFRPNSQVIYRATLYAEGNSETPIMVALFVEGAALESVSDRDKLAELVGIDLTQGRNIQIVDIFEVTARDPEAPQTIETLINCVAQIEKVGIAMVRPPGEQAYAKLQIRTLSSEGPLDTRPASHWKILASTPGISEAEQTREVLTRLLRRAYRRPPSIKEVERLAEFVESVQSGGLKWEVGIQQALKIILCSPKFLFRFELDASPQTPDPRPIDEFQLASRLSYFLWSTMPDDELLALAEKKQLTGNLEAQVKRMLADPKSSELARNFGKQWLQIERLETFTPDREQFPTFTPELRDAMAIETELFLNAIFRDDHSILDILDADYTFLNKTLVDHYDITKVERDSIAQTGITTLKLDAMERFSRQAFERVRVPDVSRGGILTHASILTVTSNPTRTSPVKRGRWVLEQLLGSPPPLPPPNVPELIEEHETVQEMSLRERLERHRADPACANCHAKMDPIGFSLENYNAIGVFRTKDRGMTIDATAELPDGTTFDGIAGLKRILKDRKQQFARCLTEKMLTYALGRGLEYYDRATVMGIVRKLKSKNYRSSVLITEIVKSDPFRLRRGTLNEH